MLGAAEAALPFAPGFLPAVASLGRLLPVGWPFFSIVRWLEPLTLAPSEGRAPRLTRLAGPAFSFPVLATLVSRAWLAHRLRTVESAAPAVAVLSEVNAKAALAQATTM